MSLLILPFSRLNISISPNAFFLILISKLFIISMLFPQMLSRVPKAEPHIDENSPEED